MNEALCSKEELQKQLNSTSSCIVDTVKKQKQIHCKLTENYNKLWNKYQNKKKELDNCKNAQECLSNKIEELNKKCDKLLCMLKEQGEKNKCLEEEYNQLEQCLKEERNNVTCLKAKNQKQKMCLERTSEELNRTTQLLTEQCCEITKIKEEHCKLKSKSEYLQDELSLKIDKCNLIELQLTKNKEIAKTEVQLQKYRNIELDQTLCKQNNQLQELIEMLAKDNEKINVLKETIGKERIEAENSIDKIRHKKLKIEKEREELKKNLEEHMEKLKCSELQIDHLKIEMNELQYKLNITIKDSNEKQKSSAECMDKIKNDVQKLKTEITSKNQIITQLEQQICEAKKMHMIAIENISDLKKKLEKLRDKPVKCISNSNQCVTPRISSTTNHNYQITDHVNKVLHELKLDNDGICSEVLEGNTQNFENLIVQCNSIINHFDQ